MAVTSKMVANVFPVFDFLSIHNRYQQIVSFQHKFDGCHLEKRRHLDFLSIAILTIAKTYSKNSAFFVVFGRHLKYSMYRARH
jgi:hypothetical protein